ncbi:Isoquinoline 1-oxidoreductase subunit alpha [compost metagenome]
MKATLNGQSIELPPVDEQMPLLWVLRDSLNMRGTKFGCGVGMCGACTVHVDGAPMRACITPISAVAGSSITTIEGLGGKQLEALDKAWLELQVAQCGYCQPGQIMSAAILIAETSAPSDEEIDSAMSGNLCRCGTYPRIRQAIKAAAAQLRAGDRA